MWFDKRAFIEFLVLVAALIIALIAFGLHLHSQFSVVYSLDKRHNDQQIISVINDAQKYVYFAVYTFTEADIAEALIQAKRRGLIVWGLTDADQASIPEEAAILGRLREAGIAVETQKHQDGIMHIKAVVTDRQYASGSYNWTESATDANDEVLEISSNNYLRQKYLAIIKKILVINQ